MKLRHVIRNVKDPWLYWSNSDGWVGYANATIFTSRERNTLRLPIDGEWMQQS